MITIVVHIERILWLPAKAKAQSLRCRVLDHVRGLDHVQGNTEVSGQ